MGSFVTYLSPVEVVVYELCDKFLHSDGAGVVLWECLGGRVIVPHVVLPQALGRGPFLAELAFEGLCPS